MLKLVSSRKTKAAILAIICMISNRGCSDTQENRRSSVSISEKCKAILTQRDTPNDRSAYRKSSYELKCEGKVSYLKVINIDISDHDYAVAAKEFSGCVSSLPVGVDLSKSYPITMTMRLMTGPECHSKTEYIKFLSKLKDQGLKPSKQAAEYAPWLDIAREVGSMSSRASVGAPDAGALLGFISTSDEPTLVCLSLLKIGSDFYPKNTRVIRDGGNEACIREYLKENRHD